MTCLLPKTQKVYAKRDIFFEDYDTYIHALYLALNAGIMYDTEPQRFEDEFSDNARKIVNGPEKIYFPVWMTEVPNKAKLTCFTYRSISTYFTDDSYINFHDKVFRHFFKRFGKK